MRPMLAAFAALFAVPAILPAAPVTLAVAGGTLGVGPELTYRVSPVVAVRGSATFLGFSGKGDTGGYRHQGQARVANGGGGGRCPPLRRRLPPVRRPARHRARPHPYAGHERTDVTFGPMRFTPEQVGVIRSRIGTRSVSPMATMGWNRTSLAGFTAGVDGGVLFHGRPGACCHSVTGKLATNPDAQAGYADQMAQIRHAIGGYRHHPVVQLSLGYRF